AAGSTPGRRRPAAGSGRTDTAGRPTSRTGHSAGTGYPRHPRVVDVPLTDESFRTCSFSAPRFYRGAVCVVNKQAFPTTRQEGPASWWDTPAFDSQPIADRLARR